MSFSEPAWKKFENLVSRILTANNFKITINKERGDSGFDLNGFFGNEKWAIEVKYYRTARARPSLIQSAASRVYNNGLMDKADKGMLVVSSIISSELRLMIASAFSIITVDRRDLRNYCSRFPDLMEELDFLLESDSIQTNENGAEKSRIDNVSLNQTPLIEKEKTPPIDEEGSKLCYKLELMKKGKATWVQYEELCIEILKYLFPNDLQGWHSQKRTDDNISRFDYICRVRPVTEFWSFLVDHINSRYILFEFKNYTGKIKQGQVLTTEKYLLERGLRKVAIIISRVGADKNAIKMMQGAMREHGKLMLVIDDEAVKTMLQMKEHGEDPTDFLFELADEFLLSLPR